MALNAFLCASLQLPRDQQAFGKGRARGVTCLARWVGCVPHPLPPFAGSSGGRRSYGRAVPGPLALWGVWAVRLLGPLLPVMASFSKAPRSLLAPREGA